MASVPGVLDFIVPYILFNVQSATLAHPLWTSAYLNSASTSNPPCLLIPFGLPYAFPLLQCPICHACSSLLDFSIPFLRFNIQSTALAHPFWTSSCRISALTSNSPCIHIPHKRESNSSLRSGRRKAEVHRTSCAPNPLRTLPAASGCCVSVPLQSTQSRRPQDVLHLFRML